MTWSALSQSATAPSAATVSVSLAQGRFVLQEFERLDRCAAEAALLRRELLEATLQSASQEQLAHAWRGQAHDLQLALARAREEARLEADALTAHNKSLTRRLWLARALTALAVGAGLYAAGR